MANNKLQSHRSINYCCSEFPKIFWSQLRKCIWTYFYLEIRLVTSKTQKDHYSNKYFLTGPDATMALRSPQREVFLWLWRDNGSQVTREGGLSMALTRRWLSGHHRGWSTKGSCFGWTLGNGPDATAAVRSPRSGRCLWREFRGSGRQLLYNSRSQ